MKRDNKTITLRAFLIYVVINTVAYALAHTEYLFMNDTVGEIFSYLSYYVSRSVEFIAPPVIATLTFLAFCDGGIKNAIYTSLTVASARLIYTLPYYYLTFVYNYRYDSIEALCPSVGASALVVLLTSLGALVCLGTAVLILRRNGVTSKDELSVIAKHRATASFLDKACLPLTVFVLLRFGFDLVKELVDTVTFFIEYGGDYTAAEIATMLVNYVLLFVLLIAAYLVCMVIKNALTNTDEVQGD